MITDLHTLTDTVSDLAIKQASINEAKARLNAQVEAAKLAYDEATRDITAEINAGFEAITAYCEEHKDALFPLKKNGTRQKTLAILQHKLQYRASSGIDAPDNVIDLINRRISDLQFHARSLTGVDHDAIRSEIEILRQLIRQPDPELNKDIAAGLANSDDNTDILAAVGITRQHSETFKLTFTFTPGADA